MPACGMTRPTLMAPPRRGELLSSALLPLTLLPQPAAAALTLTAPSTRSSCRRLIDDPGIALPFSLLHIESGRVAGRRRTIHSGQSGYLSRRMTGGVWAARPPSPAKPLTLAVARLGAPRPPGRNRPGLLRRRLV